MSKIAQLKKKAAEFEQKRQYDKALQAYLEVLTAEEASPSEETDVALYNRVGDLMLRLGNVGDAVTYYEKAVDKYEEGGFYNNAIALCNKILRHSPGRAIVYYKLGKISAHKGFKSDAKANFLEYASRMQKAGQIDAAFKALKEFADLSPDQDDIRLMLAEQLKKEERGSEAIEQLQILLDRYAAEGRDEDVRSTTERMKAIDPALDPRPSGNQRAQKADDLIFIDLDAPAAPRRPTSSVPSVPVVPPPAAEPIAPLETIEPLDLEPMVDVPGPTVEPAPIELEGLETTSVGSGPAGDDIPLIELDSTPGLGEIETTSGGDLPLLDVPDEAPQGGALEFLMPDAPAEEASPLVGLPLVSPDAPIDPNARVSVVGGISMSDELLSESGLADERPALDFLIGGDQAHDVGDASPLAGLDVTMPEEAEAEAERPRTRSTTSVLAQSAEGLASAVASSPEDWGLRRQYGEALLDDGRRAEGLAELELAMVGWDKANDVESARSVADEIVRLNPNSVRHHQKRVEYCFRANDRTGLVDAYLELADALLRDGQTEKSRAVYQRVLELAPGHARAEGALSSFVEPAAQAPVPESKPTPRASGTTAPKRYTGMDMPAIRDEPPAAAAASGDDDYVDLGDWLRDDEPERSTRMVVDEREPSGDEEADFQDMLRKFKQGVAENVDEEDYDSHYDLGVAFKEMGLLDEAIAEFQKALRGTEHRVRTYEALGQCFIEKDLLPVAKSILTRALEEKGLDDAKLVGVLYLLGQTHETLDEPTDARRCYERVLAVDFGFADVATRLGALPRVSR